jgi:hypothetical protein
LENGDGLKVGSLDEVQMNEDMIRKSVGRIHHGKYGEVHSMLIYKNGLLVFEEYFERHQYKWDAFITQRQRQIGIFKFKNRIS